MLLARLSGIINFTNQDHQPALNFLISDISGERLKMARDSSSAIQELDLLNIASDVIYIIDGEKLSNKMTREATLFNTGIFLRRALDEGMLGTNTNLKIVVSKWDTLCNDSSFNFDELIKNNFQEQFDNRLKSLSFTKIAARPRQSVGEISFGYGVFDLLNEWVEKAMNPSVETHLKEKLEGDRYFDNFKS